MRMSFMMLVISTFILVTPNNNAKAQVPFRLGLITGINFANQTFSSRTYWYPENPKTYRSGFIFGGVIDIGFTGFWSIYFEPKYIQKGTKFKNIPITSIGPTPIGTTDAIFKLNYFDFPIFLKKKFDYTLEFKPYLLFGPGFSVNGSSKIDAPGTHVLDKPNTSSLDIIRDVNSLDITLNIGTGVEYKLADKTDLFFDLRYSRGISDVYSNTKIPTAKSYGISLQAGILFNISRVAPNIGEKHIYKPIGKDTDGDRLTDDEESTKYRTDPSKADTDGDGLNDGDEVLKYYTDPLRVDTDNDSLHDGDEVIKHKTNPLNGDTDGDGLSDGAEVNWYKTNPLDPDTDHGSVKDGFEVFRRTNPLDPSDDIARKEEFKIEVGKSIVLEGIVFKTGSAEISPGSAAILEKAFNTLQQNPDIIVEIHGHTDNVGKRGYNMKLSLSRASSVKDYLIQRGIAENRIAIKGFGFDRPLVSNETPENRQKNRRIEFFRIK
ncbi:MAG: OmpA family protein [Bacteroidota bacterium]|nr:OmpA family protein [Bacteroidota bacterium]